MRNNRTVICLLLSTLALIASACGEDNDKVANSSENPRTVTIEMRDNDFRSGALEFKRGETVRFVFSNKGAVAHDAFIGDLQAQSTHEAQMRSNTTMKHGAGMDGTGNMGRSLSEGITIPPGKSRELMHTFDESGSLEIGCHQPGHYESGMRTRVKVY